MEIVLGGVVFMLVVIVINICGVYMAIEKIKAALIDTINDLKTTLELQDQMDDELQKLKAIIRRP